LWPIMVDTSLIFALPFLPRRTPTRRKRFHRCMKASFPQKRFLVPPDNLFLMTIFRTVHAASLKSSWPHSCLLGEIQLHASEAMLQGCGDPGPRSKLKHPVIADHPFLELFPAGLMLLTGVPAATVNVRCSRRQVVEQVPFGGKCGLKFRGFSILELKACVIVTAVWVLAFSGSRLCRPF